MNLKDFLGAIVDFTIAISLNQKNAESYLNRGYAKIASVTYKSIACMDFTIAQRLGSKAATDALAQYCK
jgi:hypothetical protein